MQTLDQFLKQARQNISDFEVMWLMQNKRDPENFPMAMKDGNEGLWWEMLNDFDGEKLWAEK